ncbi:MAG: prephenate dehydratase [Bacillota bacterium]|uniref:Prephenate dehydratase n=1 Tax=Virgibacillus salarius TaxID=447199 RepID=A0A941DZB4_9BACI|nr:MULTISPECIES: prephenate dehydratase [Bacillaceae]NAZ10544.1 prephenate dehydratase [Agaribacter marinus]MBR7797834.1 prephenate dehydratase [Virgibacillus salarius]MCC2251136.1 prephenate dehydratase [Virgibacillus sp. AGTR]MDY7045285.1 prephenate dehydratase [Virgibacillus sp. M23]QRZ17553.1 prephenate dehydratase [Virgibacillus sp. AGTR]
MTAKIGYLGPKGTFTKLAVDTAFNGETKHSFDTIPECIDAVEADEIDVGVVPLENAIEGTVQLTVDYLVHQVRIPIMSEIVVPIQQHLLVSPDFSGALTDVEEVHSHSHAIAQCHQYLHKHLSQARLCYTSSTGKAAQMVSETNKPIAAIGNKLAAKTYGLRMIQEDIHDFPNNHTRFAVLSKNKASVHINHSVQSEKTTLLITLPSDYAGALHQVLSAFSWRKMNLSKIESRPMKTGLGNYFFIIDVNQPYDDVLFPGVRGELEALGCKVTMLGTYPVYQMDV